MCTPQHTVTNWKRKNWKKKGGRSGGSYVLGLYLFFEEGSTTYLFSQKWTKWTKLTEWCAPQHTLTNWKNKGGQEFLRLLGLYLYFFLFEEGIVQHLTHYLCQKVSNKVNSVHPSWTHWQTEKKRKGQSEWWFLYVFYLYFFVKKVKNIIYVLTHYLCRKS